MVPLLEDKKPPPERDELLEGHNFTMNQPLHAYTGETLFTTRGIQPMVILPTRGIETWLHSQHSQPERHKP